MKYLSVALFVGYLLFISAKSLVNPVTFQEVAVLLTILVFLVGEKALKALFKLALKHFLLKNKELQATIDMNKPSERDSEIVKLERENELANLRLRKFMTEQEFNKREITRALEKQIGEGGVRF